MKAVRRLLKTKKIYDLSSSEAVFIRAMKENVLFHYHHCDVYRQILEDKQFDPQKIETMTDIENLPFLTTLFFKRNHLETTHRRKRWIEVTSSGTSGQRSVLSYDLPTLWHLLKMLLRTSKVHHLHSIRPSHYVLFGYQPTKKNKTVISKTTNGFTYMAPCLSKTFALPYRNGEYKVDLEGIKKAFQRIDKKHRPLRTAGFPAYICFVLEEMKQENIRLKMHPKSLVTVGGGWKQFFSQKIDKRAFYKLIEDVLGLKEDRVKEFFSAVEHPILYVDCKHHHFHVPVYARVIIRDPKTMKPLPMGQAGLLNFVTPLLENAPLCSIMTDDLAILHDGKSCGCGIESPYFEILGRVGVEGITTCAAGAQTYLKGEN